MDRRESRIHNLRSRVVPCPSPGGVHPVSSDASPLPAEGRPSFRRERSEPLPDSRPNRRIKKFHIGVVFSRMRFRVYLPSPLRDRRGVALKRDMDIRIGAREGSVPWTDSCDAVLRISFRKANPRNDSITAPSTCQKHGRIGWDCRIDLLIPGTVYNSFSSNKSQYGEVAP